MHRLAKAAKTDSTAAPQAEAAKTAAPLAARPSTRSSKAIPGKHFMRTMDCYLSVHYAVDMLHVATRTAWAEDYSNCSIVKSSLEQSATYISKPMAEVAVVLDNLRHHRQC